MESSTGSSRHQTVDCDVVLRDGSTLTLRIAGPDDGPAVLAFLRGLSNQSHISGSWAPPGST